MGSQSAQDAGTDPQELVLDLSDAGSAFVINVSTDPDTGLQSGSVEFQDEGGQAVGWGHFDGVADIILPADPTSYYYSESDLTIIGEHGPGLPPKVSLDDYIEERPIDDDPNGSGGSLGSGSGGSKGSGSGGSKGSGSGGSKGHHGKGHDHKGSGSGGSKGSGSGGSKGHHGKGHDHKGSGSGGSKGSGSGGSKGHHGKGHDHKGHDHNGHHHGQAGLPHYQPHAEDIMQLMTQDVEPDTAGGTVDAAASGGTDIDLI